MLLQFIFRFRKLPEVFGRARPFCAWRWRTITWVDGKIEAKMLSRLAFRSVNLAPATACATVQARHTSTDTNTRWDPVKRYDKVPPVRFGFMPDSWFTFFYPKTGVTGPYMFGLGVGTYLLSKEIYVCEHEFYNGLSFLLIWIFVTKKYGPQVANFLSTQRQKKIDDYYDQINNNLDGHKKSVETEEQNQRATEAHPLIMEAKKENIKMQLEAVYRERLLEIYNSVKKRLDYQVQLHNAERRLAQKHMAQWVIHNVLKSITPEQEKASLQQCIKDLQMLAKA